MTKRSSIVTAIGIAVASTVPQLVLGCEDNAAHSGPADAGAIDSGVDAGDDGAYDVVIVGAGAAGLSAAHGVLRENPTAKIVVLEAAALPGGTTIRSGARMWIPNNADMVQRGLSDPKDMALKYMAKNSYPSLYDPAKPNLGLDNRHLDLLSAYYDNGSEIFSYYRNENILSWQAEVKTFTPAMTDSIGIAGKLATDYHAEFAEDVPKVGRSVLPLSFPNEFQGIYPGYNLSSDQSLLGPDLILWLYSSAVKKGVAFDFNTRLVDLVADADSSGNLEVKGVVTTVGTGAESSSRVYQARKGVILATGGFGKSQAKLQQYYSGDRSFTGGGCSVLTAQGVSIDIAAKWELPLENMNEAWFIENIYEQYKIDPDSLKNQAVPRYGLLPNYLVFQAYWLAGDSMVSVNRHGLRQYNEKAPYNDRGRVHFQTPDNKFMLAVWDQHVTDNYVNLGGQITPVTRNNIGPAADLPALRTMIADRLKALGVTDYELADDFVVNLGTTIDRYNGFAVTGTDLDFHRGESPNDVWWHSVCLSNPIKPGVPDCISANTDAEGKRYKNITMRPLAAPYYATILSSGLQDTKGGPSIDANARILSKTGAPAKHLYGAGNSIGSPAAAGYWGAGGTLGPAVVFGHIAGRSAARGM